MLMGHMTGNQKETLYHLQHSWYQLMRAYGIQQESAQSVLTELIEAYSSDVRYYHTLEHVRSVLDTIETLSHHAQNLPAIRLAAWFHDSIYDTHADDNEERSAEYAATALHRLGLPPETAQAVYHMIISTRTHQAEDEDCHILLDADLAILGASLTGYNAYAQAIRHEYRWVPEATYRSARKQVLQAFLQRAHIYHIDEMVQRLEAQARKNIQREIYFL